MARPAKPDAAQKPMAEKAAAVKAGSPVLSPPSLEPQEWGLCYQALNALFKGGVDGAPVAVAVLNAMGKIEPYLKAAQAAQQPPQ